MLPTIVYKDADVFLVLVRGIEICARSYHIKLIYIRNDERLTKQILFPEYKKCDTKRVTMTKLNE